MFLKFREAIYFFSAREEKLNFSGPDVFFCAFNTQLVIWKITELDFYLYILIYLAVDNTAL